MSPLELEQNWLSLRHWLRATVLPVSLVLIAVLFLLKLVISHPYYLDQAAALIGFACLYFMLVRGGHLVMIRSMHFDLKEKFGERYEKRLSKLPPNLKQVNLGFSLARIKRDLTQNPKNKN